MEFKDVASIFISALAFILSAIATVVSTIRGKYEEQRAIRNQLSDTLNRIAMTYIDNAKLHHEMAAKDPAYYRQLSGMLNQQQTSLLNQAMYLADQLPPKIVTAVEMNTIALANFSAGDVILAEKYYHKAVDVSPSNYYRSLATRSYAEFLFTQRRFEEGRAQFRQAVSLISGGDNQTRYTNGYTYQSWAWNELNNAGARLAAGQLFESAQNEFRGIDNEEVRKNSIDALSQALPSLAQKSGMGGPPAGPPAAPHSP